MQKVVVIGAGVGGLSAAALLAKAGFEVSVLEAHVYPGGCAGTFFHKGYRFDAGATLAGGFQPGGPHAIIAERLGISFPIRRSDPAWVVQLPDQQIQRWSDPQAWAQERAEKLPAMRHFWAQQEYTAEAVWRLAARVPPFPPASLGDWPRLLRTLRPGLLPVAPLALMRMEHWLGLNRIRDRRSRTFVDAQLLISAQATAEEANALYGAVAMDLPRVGVYHVQGGMGTIARTLAQALESFGGSIHYRQQVQQLIPRQDGTFLLHTNKHLDFEADVVLGNLTPWALLDLLGEAAPPALRREVQQRGDPWGAFTLYAGVEAAAVADRYDHYQVIREYDKALGEGNSVFISISDAQDSSRAPAGQRAITMSTHTNLRSWWDLERRYPAAYEARKEAYQEELLQAAEKVIPGIRQHLQLLMPGTPLTFQRYTRRPLGMVGGFPTTSLLKVRGPQTGIPNLWLVGDSIFPGQSTAGVTAGALRVAAEVRQAAQESRLQRVLPMKGLLPFSSAGD